MGTVCLKEKAINQKWCPLAGEDVPVREANEQVLVEEGERREGERTEKSL